MITLNRLEVGDACEKVRSLSDESISLTVTSPPYDKIRKYTGEETIDLVTLSTILYDKTQIGGVCVLVMNDQTVNRAKSGTTFRTACTWMDAGWRLFETCIYSRHGNPGAWWTHRFRVDHEYILIFYKGERLRAFDKKPLMVPTKHSGKVYSGTDRLFDGSFKTIDRKVVASTKCRGTIWDIASSNTEGNRLKLQHPATMPDALARDLILCFSLPGDIVLDPMCGSGTTLVQALQEDRHYCGFDISTEYVDLSRRCLAQVKI